jgi:hypothetical protein
MLFYEYQKKKPMDKPGTAIFDVLCGGSWGDQGTDRVRTSEAGKFGPWGGGQYKYQK